MNAKQMLPQSLISKKQNKEKITALTSYDYWTSFILNEIGIDVILVGDSLGTLMLGYENTLPVTMDDMIHHAKAVVRGNKTSLVVGDMPFMSDSVSIAKTVKNAGRFIKEAGASAVKIEGGANIKKTIKALIGAGIPVMGHIGLTPQDVLVLGGYKKQKDRDKLLNDALKVEEAGAFSVVLECIPEEIAKEISQKLKIPTIGIASGPYTDGQVLVLHDLVGFNAGNAPKFVKPYANLKNEMIKAINAWKKDVKS